MTVESKLDLIPMNIHTHETFTPRSIMEEKHSDDVEDYPTKDAMDTDEQDVLLGAYLIAHLRNICENCGINETPQWRKGWWSDTLNRYTMLCNKCGLKYHKNQFCPYCRYVYGKETDKNASVWLTCNSCGRWVHINCEITAGCGREHLYDSYGVYHCPDCKSRSPRKI